MEKRVLGKTGLEVSILGLGGAQIGFEREEIGDDEAIGRFLNTLLDNGVTLLDTAECYHDSEELIGRYVGHRRSEYTLTTKIGHEVVKGAGPDWSVSQLEASIDNGLKRLRTDRVDVLQLHTCSKDLLEKGDVVDVLVRAREAGKTRFIGYSGDNEHARYAVEMGVFDTLQTSFSILDQAARRELIPAAKARGMGIIAKRPIANAVGQAGGRWTEYSRPYRERNEAIQWPEFDEGPIELSLRYTLSFPISCAIVGSKNADHVLENIRIAGKGPLPEDRVRALNEAYDAADQGWEQRS